MTSRLLAITALLALALAACGTEEPAGAPDTAEEAADDALDATETEPAETEPTETEPTEEGDADATEDDAAEPAEATVVTTSTDLGEVLVASDGLTLYLFDNDEGGDSTCYDDCAANWPPLTVDGEPTAGDGADQGLLGTTERDDGTVQVTYAGHPLYYFAGDSTRGDVNGQGVADVWWAVTPAGEAAGEEEAADSGGGYSDY